MQVLTDAQWGKFEAAIAAAELRGARPRKDDRQTIAAPIWRLDKSAKWRSIPAELGPGIAHTCGSGVGRSPVWGTAFWLIYRLRGMPNSGLLASTARLLGRIRKRLARVGASAPGTRSVEFAIHVQHHVATKHGVGREAGWAPRLSGSAMQQAACSTSCWPPGQAHELAPSLLLLKRLPTSPTYALADMACDALQFRTAAQDMGTIPVVPSRKGARAPKPGPSYIYRHRNLIERCWSRLKERRAIATATIRPPLAWPSPQQAA